VPQDAALEVPLSHPDLDWFAELRLRWHAVPAISNMPLSIGGITYTGDWDAALAANAAQLGRNAAAVAQQPSMPSG
jgi:nitric oxide synthase oxygenase domain/subunit